MNRAEILNAADKPPRLEILPLTIPEILKQHDRWLVWRWEKRNGKWQKPPYCVRTGRYGSSTDLEQWCTFDEAIEAYQTADYDGIGFALGDAGDGVNFCGFDFDDCRDPESGEITGGSSDLFVEMLGTYAEVSPSNTGIKAIAIAKLPNGPRTNKAGNIEVYDRGRYFTITGARLPNAADDVTKCEPQVRELYELLIGSAQHLQPDRHHERNGKPHNEECELAIEALGKLSQYRRDNYQEWLRVGMCLHATSPELLDAWEEWSAESDSHQEDACEAKWESFKRSGLSLGSLIYMAMQDSPGWKPERQSESESESEFILPRITSAELDSADYELSYVIEGTLVEGQPAILAGGHKCLKTSISIDLAVSVASGGYFLGKKAVSRSYRVGVLSAESGMSTIQETARRVSDAANVQLRDLEIIWSDSLPKFSNPLHRKELTRWCQYDGLELIILDPAYLAMPSENSNNLMAQGELLRAMGDACQEAGAMPILCHHTKRTVVDLHAPPELTDIAWSGFAEYARQWLLVGRREPFEPGTGEHRLWLNVGGSAGHSALWAVDIDEGTFNSFEPRKWQVELERPDEARREAKERRQTAATLLKAAAREAETEEAMRRLCEILTKGPETKTGLKNRAGWNGKKTDQMIAEGLEREVIRECRFKKHTREEDGFELIPDAE